MRLSIVVLTYNLLDRTKGQWQALVSGTTARGTDAAELVVVDQGSTDGTPGWLRRFVLPRFKHGQLVQLPDNLGVPRALNEGWRAATGDVIACLHNDLYVTEWGWDRRVLAAFHTYPSVGLVGFAGARGLGADGGRREFWSNLLEAELHGSRGWGLLPVAMLDGLALIARRRMLEQVGGWDESYPPHHYYDYDISCASMAAGWGNLLIGIECHHESGITASSPGYIEWVNAHYGSDQKAHDDARARYVRKWGRLFPLTVEDWVNRPEGG